MNSKKFAHLSVGVFFATSALSLVILMLMFIFVWQPIWTEGFKDFHTVSSAIKTLNETAKPASELAPEILLEMKKMTNSMAHIESSMHSMTYTIDSIGQSMTGQMHIMNNEVNQMGNRLSPFGMMPFNW